MANPEKLYEAFGELLYVVAMADGEIQKEELEVLHEELEDYRYGKEVKWSFDYEMNKKNPVEDTYKKVITYCEGHGPEKEYAFIIRLLEKMSKASNGMDDREAKTISNFRADLIKKFIADIDRINRG